MNDPNLCPVHGLPWALVPAGVSKKTGRAYAQFRACQIKGCEMKPQAITQHVPTVAVEAPQAPQQPRQGQTSPPTDCSSTSSLRDQAGGATGTNWAAKDRLICAQTAAKAASVFYAGTGMVGEFEALAERIFMAFMEVQAGRTFRFISGSTANLYDDRKEF